MKEPRSKRNLFRLAMILAFALALCVHWLRDSSARYQEPSRQPHQPSGRLWIEPGQGGVLPAELSVVNSRGKLGVLNASGPIEMRDHAFFEPQGLNLRACVTCHQPADGMSVSVESLRERWRVTKGDDLVFAAVDASNNPKLPQGIEISHSLLLNRGLFRIGLQWPPHDRQGRVIKPEFTIEVVRDPTGVNLDTDYGLTGANPTVSVFRRSRPVANMKYVMSPDDAALNKPGAVLATDPETGLPVAMNLMSDSRHLTLKPQALAAYRDHQEGRHSLSRDQLREIVEFEMQIYVAQSVDKWGGSLIEAGGPTGLGPQALAKGELRPGADRVRDSVFHSFDSWKAPEGMPKGISEAQREFRASVARGADLFATRQFWIRDVAHINTGGQDSPIKGTCATCHSARMIGQSAAAGWADLGTANYPRSTDPKVFSSQAELPIFKCVCDESAPPHPFLGRVIYTTDPGRSLITGKCADIGAIVPQQLRGLSARAPYFVNGSAKSLREVVDYHDRRFDMKLSEREKLDLENFLSVL
jgi:mono/diheme cytochrome c family protein